MKKLISALSTLALLVVGATGCTTDKPKTSTSSSVPSTSTPVSSTPGQSSSIVDTCGGTYFMIEEVIMTGIVDSEAVLGKRVNLKEGVSIAYSMLGMTPTLMTYVTITSDKGEIDASGNLNTYMLAVDDVVTVTYTISAEKLIGACMKVADGQPTVATRKITILAGSDEMIMNGDIETPLRDNGSLPGWNSYMASGGGADFGKWGVGEEDGNHYLYLDVTKLSANSYEPRLNTDEYDPNAGMLLQTGEMYQVTFRAKADHERQLYLQVGELLGPVAPYFYQFGLQYFTLSEQWMEFKYTFLMEEETTSMGHLVFECGTINNVWVAGKVYLDDVQVKHYDGEELPPEEQPTFAGIRYAYRRQGTGTFNVLEGITATDMFGVDISANITTTITNANNETISAIDLSVLGTYTVVYEVTDSYGNWKVEKRRVDVIAIDAPEPNLFGVPNNSVIAGTQELVYSNLGQFMIWTDPGNAESGATITFDQNKPCKFENNELSITYITTTTTARSYAVQLFYKSPIATSNSTFVVSFDVVSQHNTLLQINGNEFQINVGTTHVSYEVNGLGVTMNIQFGGSYDSNTLAPSGTYVFKNLKIM